MPEKEKMQCTCGQSARYIAFIFLCKTVPGLIQNEGRALHLGHGRNS